MNTGSRGGVKCDPCSDVSIADVPGPTAVQCPHLCSATRTSCVQGPSCFHGRSLNECGYNHPCNPKMWLRVLLDLMTNKAQFCGKNATQQRLNAGYPRKQLLWTMVLAREDGRKRGRKTRKGLVLPSLCSGIYCNVLFYKKSYVGNSAAARITRHLLQKVQDKHSPKMSLTPSGSQLSQRLSACNFATQVFQSGLTDNLVTLVRIQIPRTWQPSTIRNHKTMWTPWGGHNIQQDKENRSCVTALGPL